MTPRRAVSKLSGNFVLFRFRAFMRDCLCFRQMGEKLRAFARVITLVMSLARSTVSSATCAALCAGAGAMWGSLALAQEEGGTAAQAPAANPNKQSFQMKPVTADVANS